MQTSHSHSHSHFSLVTCHFALVLAVGLGFGSFVHTANASDVRQQLFERVFGNAVRLDPDMVAKVKAGAPGERHFVDRDGDGRNDEVWFIDTEVRHNDQARPILVRVIDEDGDLDTHLGPDLDSDLYVADWQADGTADVLLDYQDNDGDGDVDEMAFYFYVPHHAYFGDDVLRVWWGQDDGDDNLLWYDVNYTYYQGLCQYRCHFSGDESFVAFGLMPGRDQWVSAFENPFLFYDLDDDTCSEVVLRIEGHDDEVRAVRYSFDADDDAFGQRTHDYDFSITTRAPEDDPVRLPRELVRGMTLRGIPTQAWLQREHARRFVEHAPWQVAVLTWDEMNANTEGNVERDPHERWEGIIAPPSEHFAQVGGPPCSPLNKRNEVATRPVAPMTLYYDPADHRLHLKGANEGWLHVDCDLDGTIDAKYTYHDDDKDGFFDRRQIDVDADGEIEFEWKMSGSGAREFDLDWRKLADFWRPTLEQTLADSQAFIDAAHSAPRGDVPAEPGPVPGVLRDRAASYYLNELASWMPATRLGERIRKTPAGACLYVGLVRDRLFAALKSRYGSHAAWPEVESAYAAGAYRDAAELVRTHFVKPPLAVKPEAYGEYTRRIPIQVDNRGGPQRDDWPVTIRIADLRGFSSLRAGTLEEPPASAGGSVRAADFNPGHCAVVAPDRWIDWREVPHQIDEIDPETGPEISFLIDARADEYRTWYLYYAPTGHREPTFPRKTATAEDWVPPNIGWESNRVAYRMYWGQFDFFGKKIDRLIYDDIGATSYHRETDWGIDALHVGEASGLGGLTLYAGNKGYGIQNPAGKGSVEFTKRVLCAGPVRAAIEVTAKNIVPDRPELAARMRCIVYAERQESSVLVRLTGHEASMLLAPGLVKLPRERFIADAKSGCIASWGWQQAVIDEIGMGIIFSPDAFVDVVDLPDEHRVRCRISGEGELRYWIIGDWRRGRQHPVAPTLDNWHGELRQLAASLFRDVKVEIGSPEDVGD